MANNYGAYRSTRWMDVKNAFPAESRKRNGRSDEVVIAVKVKKKYEYVLGYFAYDNNGGHFVSNGKPFGDGVITHWLQLTEPMKDPYYEEDEDEEDED